MFLYILIGIFLNMAYDLFIDLLDDKEELRFNFFERMVVIILWPLALYQFIKGMFR